MVHVLGFFIKCGYAELRGAGVNGFLLFIWQGVTMYLTPEGVDASWRSLVKNAAPGSAVVF